MVTAIPAVFMIVVTLWASVLNQVEFHAGDNNLLKVINVIIIVIAVWMTIEGIIMFYKKFVISTPCFKALSHTSEKSQELKYFYSSYFHIVSQAKV